MVVLTLSTHRPAEAHQIQSSAVQFAHVWKVEQGALHGPAAATLLHKIHNYLLI